MVFLVLGRLASVANKPLSTRLKSCARACVERERTLPACTIFYLSPSLERQRIHNKRLAMPASHMCSHVALHLHVDDLTLQAFYRSTIKDDSSTGDARQRASERAFVESTRPERYIPYMYSVATELRMQSSSKNEMVYMYMQHQRREDKQGII